uniref:Predicted gene 1043 n=1 Tax=Nannospalax galili TaxID=1026970 RepID=A0A8C6W413_NANGA
MESAAQEQTEQIFSYVVRAPSTEGFDVMNVDVKIDTCWVFRDVEESSEEQEEQGCLPEAATGSPDVDTGLLRKQLESSEQTLLAAVDKYMMSESGLRNRVQELELSERRLILKVDQLTACVAQERSASLHVQEQLQALQGELASRVREAERWQRWRHWRLRERLQSKDEALAQQAAALERCRRTQRQQLGLVREQEFVLRVQVQQLERDVRRLGCAAGLLLAQLDRVDPSPGSSSHQPQVWACPRGVREAEAARRLREQRLREQLEELRCCVYGLTLSDIGLHRQLEELAEQNRCLQAQLEAQGTPDCVQSDLLPLPRAEVLDPCRNQVHSDRARGCQAPAGQLSEEPHGCVGDGPAPCMVAPGPRTTSELQRDLAGSEHGQGAPTQPSLDGQVLLLLCGCSPGRCTDEPLYLHLAGVSESPTTAPAQEPLLLSQTPLLWGLEALLPPLLQESVLQELQTQEELGSQPSSTSRTATHPGGDCNLAGSHDSSLSQESTLTSNGLFSTEGPREPRHLCEERSAPPVARAEEWEVMGTLGTMKLEPDKCPPGQESSGKLSLGVGVQAPKGPQNKSGASDTQVTAHCPWSWGECLLLPPHGPASGSQEGPKSLSRKGRVEACGRGLLGGMPSEEEEVSRAHETREPWPNGSQPLAGKVGDVWRRARGEEGHQLGFGDIPVLREESSGGEGQEQKMRLQIAPNPACGVSKFSSVSELDHGRCQRWGPCLSQALSTGQDRCALQRDKLKREVEACFQQLNTLKLGCGGPQQMSALVGKNQSVTHTWWDIEEGMCPQKALASQGLLDTKPSGHSKGVRPEEDVALGTGDTLLQSVPDGDAANWGLAELGGCQLSTPWGTQERTGGEFHQLSTTPKKERSQVLCDNAQCQGDEGRCHGEACRYKKERARETVKTSRLEQVNHALREELGRLRQELTQSLQAMSDLEDCNGKSYNKISQLEEENEKLKQDLGQLQKVMSESVRKAQGWTECVTLENAELRALISELRVSYKELMKDVVLGIEDTVWALKGENEHLLHRVQGLEQEVASQMSRGGGYCGEERWYPKMVGDKGHSEDKEVQATPFSGHLITRACGPPWGEKSGVNGSQMEPSLGLGGSRGRADATTPTLVCGVTEGPQALEGHINGTGGNKVQQQREERESCCSVQRGQPPRSLNLSPQLQDSKMEAMEEDPKLCVQRLHHQVWTLQCQLRDQSWALWELQAGRDEAVNLQDELKGKLRELWGQQHEARLATSPLKAKLVSLVHKCQERNHLIAYLLRELRRHGLENLLLSKLTQNMLDDEALAEYATTFQTPQAPETNCCLDMGPEGTAAGGAQEYLLNSEVDSVLQSWWGMESWPPPEVQWSAQMTPVGSVKEPRQHRQAHHAEKDECPSQMTNSTAVDL